MDKVEFRKALNAGHFDSLTVRAILHQGACSNTLEDDGQYMMDNNFTYSKELLHFALTNQVPFVYASTAAVYGASTSFAVDPRKRAPAQRLRLLQAGLRQLRPPHPRHVGRQLRSTIVGLRYFNVYGPREQHKGRMASVLHHFTKQLLETGTIRMFQGSGGYADGEQRRDFVFVNDLARINMFFAGLLPESPHDPVHAILNAGTGEARTFKAVAEALMRTHRPGNIEFIPFPGDLKDRYQHFTEADISGLRAAGYSDPFTTLEEGTRHTFS